MASASAGAARGANLFSFSLDSSKSLLRFCSALSLLNSWVRVNFSILSFTLLMVVGERPLLDWALCRFCLRRVPELKPSSSDWPPPLLSAGPAAAAAANAADDDDDAAAIDEACCWELGLGGLRGRLLRLLSCCMGPELGKAGCRDHCCCCCCAVVGRCRCCRC